MVIAFSIKLRFIFKPVIWLVVSGVLPGILTGQEKTSIGVFVDNQRILSEGADYLVPAGSNTLRFSVNPGSLLTRYKLVGVDNDWNQQVDTVVFRLRFYNEKGEPIHMESFPVTGRSPGWNGSVGNSSFESRFEKVPVPPGAVIVSLIMSSGGPQSLVGIYAIKELSVRAVKDSGEESEILSTDSFPGKQGPRLWAKSGLHPAMASLVWLGDRGGPADCLVIRDDDLNAHADWISRIGSIPKVQFGEVLEIRWQEAYSTGVGGSYAVNYERLPAGRYEFVVEDLTLAGESLQPATKVAVRVQTVLWRRPWFWIAVSSVLALFSVVIGRYLIRRRIRFHLQQEQMISAERRRIALDLHDDLGTRLSHISLVASHADNTIQHEGANAAFEKISSMSRDLIGALSETVWMLNPKNDDLESLVDFLYRLVNELCRLKKIRSKVDAVLLKENRAISYEFKHNMSLAVKESVNNALKHSCATELKMSIELEKGVFIVIITDNGIGLSEDSRSDGLGLESLARRMKAIGGSCRIEEIPQGGLRIILSAPVV